MNFKIIPDKTPTVDAATILKILSFFLLLINSPMNAPMQAPKINPKGPRIKNHENSPIPVPMIPFLELPNFLAEISGKKNLLKKIELKLSG